MEEIVKSEPVAEEIEISGPRIFKDPSAPVVFSNVTAISVTPEEASLVFLQRQYDDPSAANVVATVFTTIPNLKRLIALLQEQVDAYERDFGTIQENLVDRLTPAGRKRLGIEDAQ